MIHGKKSIFAIECEPVKSENNSIYAHFQIWAAGQSIGDYTDYIDLRACSNWLKDFMLYSGKRYESSLDGKSKEEIFNLVFDSVMVTVPKGVNISDLLSEKEFLPDYEPPIYENIRERFHLDQVGMSSFSDKWNVILVGCKDHSDRLIWRNLEDLQLYETTIPPRFFDNVSLQFLYWVDSLLQTKNF